MREALSRANYLHGRATTVQEVYPVIYRRNAKEEQGCEAQGGVVGEG